MGGPGLSRARGEDALTRWLGRAVHSPAEPEGQGSRSGAVGRGAGLPEAVDLTLSAKALGQCPPGGTGQLGPPALPACKLLSASPVPSPPSKNTPRPAHRQSRAPSDDRPPNCPPQHGASHLQAPLFIQPSSPSAVPLAANGAGRFCFCPAITRLASNGGTERGWARLPPPGSFTRAMLEREGGAWGRPAEARREKLIRWHGGSQLAWTLPTHTSCWPGAGTPTIGLKQRKKAPKWGNPLVRRNAGLETRLTVPPFLADDFELVPEGAVPAGPLGGGFLCRLAQTGRVECNTWKRGFKKKPPLGHRKALALTKHLQGGACRTQARSSPEKQPQPSVNPGWRSAGRSSQIISRAVAWPPVWGQPGTQAGWELLGREGEGRGASQSGCLGSGSLGSRACPRSLPCHRSVTLPCPSELCCLQLQDTPIRCATAGQCN